MSSDIFSVNLGLNSCHLIRGKSIIMVDGGMPDKLRAFKRKLHRLYIHPEDIKLIILTHSHFDHVGSARAISEFTGAKILIHESEAGFLERREFLRIKGLNLWGKITLFLLNPFFTRIKFPQISADIIMKGEEFSLDEYGINGKIIHTPGHTTGSLTLLLHTGEAFVGCLAHDGLPFRWMPGLPIYGQDLNQIKESWKMLINKGAKVIFPGHGNPFPVKVIKDILFS